MYQVVAYPIPSKLNLINAQTFVDASYTANRITIFPLSFFKKKKEATHTDLNLEAVGEKM